MITLSSSPQDKPSFSTNAAGGTRISEFTTLFDGKTLITDNANVWENAGTGTGTWENGIFTMSVTAGQYYIRNAKRPSPYFSGKPQVVEMTCDRFEAQAGVVKRQGYFSSVGVAPFDTVFDGMYFENDGTDIRFKIMNAGTEIYNKRIQDMDNGYLANGYNYQNFTVVAFDFLWLGGAIVRIFLKTQFGFSLLETYNYSGTAQGVMMLSPNQPLRYEIRSTGGAGTFRAICSQVSTEGSKNEGGYSGFVNTGNADIAYPNSVGTTYAVLGIKKKTTHRLVAVLLTSLDLSVASNSDRLRWSLQINPTVAGTFNYADKAGNAVQMAVGAGTNIITSAGYEIAGGIAETGSWIDPSVFERNYLSYLSGTLANSMDAIVLCITELTASPSLSAVIRFKEESV